MFQKGHPYYGGTGGKKGKSGRKKSPTQALKDALDYTISCLPELVMVYTDLCSDGKHQELFQYLWDRAAGKPRGQTDIEITPGEFTAEALARMYQKLIDMSLTIDGEYKLLEVKDGQSVTKEED